MYIIKQLSSWPTKASELLLEVLFKTNEYIVLYYECVKFIKHTLLVKIYHQQIDCRKNTNLMQNKGCFWRDGIIKESHC